MSSVSHPTSPLAAPVPAWRKIKTREDACAPIPHISVIIPFHASRGHPENLTGWTRDQSLASGLFEVIAAIDESLAPEIEQELRAHLRPGDRLIAVDVDNCTTTAEGPEQRRSDEPKAANRA